MAKWKEVFKIIITHNNKQVEYIGTYNTESNALKVFNEIIQQNNKIDFPVYYVSNKYIEKARYEVILIKKRLDESIELTTKLRNEYGEFVDHSTNNEKWIVFDKAPYFKEETFWVYGYHPLVQRKTFNFILNDVIKPLASKKSNGTTLIVYNNKLIIDSLEKMELIICKNKSDCIRLYNLIEDKCNKQRIKYINYGGNWSYSKIGKQACINKIKHLTNWDEKKIKRTSTKP
jgi:hypothetical protein